jgi:lambda family phage minor tail protein L
VIALYEIDIHDIESNMSLKQSVEIEGDILRFHNMEILRGKKIIFDQQTYYSMPIIVEGFEMTSSGELPRPKLTLPSMQGLRDKEEEFTTTYPWQSLRRAVIELENLIGAKVTRIRTFAKYLDSTNDIPEVGGEPDPQAQFPRDVFYIDAKTLEDKNGLQFELSTFTDMENFKLPGRHVLASRCPWQYRGEGCCYEFKGDPGDWEGLRIVHGATGGDSGPPIHLPDYAPPIASKDNEPISEVITSYNPNNIDYSTDVIEYHKTLSFPIGQVVYLKKNHIKYYFVAKQAVPQYTPPPNTEYWVADECAKTLRACKLRWGMTGAAKNDPGTGKVIANKFLNFGGFPGTNTRISV